MGPDSAGADPGPACYRNGGPLTVTDANVCVGKIQPRHFPAIFGPKGDQPLDVDVVTAKFAALAEEITEATGQQRTPHQVAEGFLRIAVANMANAIKQVSVQKGHDATRFALQCFGGAGGQHACLVADALGMETVFIHPYAGVLSAYGMGLADQTVMREQAVEIPLEASAMAQLNELADRLAAETKATLAAQGADPANITVQRNLHLRYAGTEAALIIALRNEQEIVADFTVAHRARFGFATPDRPLVVEAVAVEAIAPGETVTEATLPARTSGAPRTIDTIQMFTGDQDRTAPVFDRTELLAGDRITGPALIREANATTVVEPGWTAEVTTLDHMTVRRTERLATRVDASSGRPDPVLLELFNNLFMNVAEQTGTVLQNTSMSVNIKERLDFSCAIFDAEGFLVANAPHVPVHLGAMGESVRTVLNHRRDTLKPGDVVALNNPFNGGTHLPDVTVITPVFDESGGKILFFVGSRGHHADIGGITPGSTPPVSHTLEEEGVVIDDFLLVDGGHFREAELRALLAGAKYPARSPDVNVADIKAQVAANEKGVQELQRVVALYGWPTVSAYMRHVMDNAEESVRRVIDRIGSGSFEYTMDSGLPLCVSVSIDRASRSAVVDFTGTGHQSESNFNSPPAVTRAAVLYVFRTLVADDIPLNDGCLKPLRLIIPPGTFLSPHPGAAVVAGNTEVSQATCNALFGALKPIACSQATMNNFLFGDATRQYYETICGGTGAGPGFDGTSAIHSHMTNTRMTDPEVLELRYPVRLERFAIRRGSGGNGKWRGGDGAIRRIRFLEPMTAVIVSSRRKVRAIRSGRRRGRRGRTAMGGARRRLTRNPYGHRQRRTEAGRCIRDRNARWRRLRGRCLTVPRLGTWLVGLAVILVLVVVAAWQVPQYLDWNRYHATLEALASKTLGQPVTIHGPITLNLLPQPMLTAAQVNIGGDTPGDASIRVEALRLRVALWPLLGGRVDARELVLRGPDLRLPWPVEPRMLRAQTPAWLAAFSARVEDGRLTMGRMAFTGINATLASQNTGALSASGTAQFNGQDWKFTARTTTVGPDGYAGLDLTLDGQGTASGLGASLSGQMASDGTFAGRISGSGGNLALLLPAPSVPFRADGRLTIGSGLVAIDDLALQLGGSPATGAVALRVAPNQRLDIALSAGRLDLDAWLPALLHANTAVGGVDLPIGVDFSVGQAAR